MSRDINGKIASIELLKNEANRTKQLVQSGEAEKNLQEFLDVKLGFDKAAKKAQAKKEFVDRITAEAMASIPANYRNY